ncbi:uncharacterized protein METZ01_LOCUS309348 [marine metagenome]|uniref:Uncharacterized protein n=1 Tax=marine metagenome TaxID=408172 RepID=A0A382N5N4_9ZZZZ
MTTEHVVMTFPFWYSDCWCEGVDSCGEGIEFFAKFSDLACHLRGPCSTLPCVA